MTDYLKLELHTFENSRAIDLTPFVERVNWRESVTRPWDSITATFALPLAQIFRTESRESTQSRASNQLGALEPRPPEYADNVTRISLLAQDERLALPMGSWLKLVDEKGLCKAFGRVPDRTIEYMAGEAGLRDSTAQLSAESWLEFLNSIDAQVFAELNDTIGTLFGVATQRWKDYSELVFKILNNPSPKLIVGAKGFLGIMASIQIPPTLFPGKSTLAELIDIAYNADTGNRLCPNRTMDEVPVFPVSSIQSIQPSGKVPDLLFSVWQPEPRLVELFPSIEKGLPILIHRFAPWRTGPLQNVVVQSGGNAPKLRNPLWGRTTWSLQGKLSLSADQGFRIASSQSDTNRVNAVTLRWNVAGPSTVRTLADLGLPLYDRDDVDKNGTRMFEFNWSIGAGYAANPLTSGVSGPQTYQDAASATSGVSGRRSGLGIAGSGLGGFTSGELLRGLAIMAWQFYGLGHVFESGTIEGEFLDTELAKAGEPFSFDYGGPIPFAGYISAIEHSVTVRDGGVTEATSTISFTRGLWDENARGATLQVEAVDSPKVDETPGQTGNIETFPILADGIDYPAAEGLTVVRDLLDIKPVPLIARMRGRPLSSPGFGPPVNIVVCHYTDGPINGTGTTLGNSFQRKINNFPTTGTYGATHFGLDPDGVLYQYVDLTYQLRQAGRDDINQRSIGIELILPYSVSLGKATQLKEHRPELPWPVETGWTIIGATGRRVARDDFFGPTPAQIASLALLMKTLNTHFGFPLTTNVNTTESKAVKRFTEAQILEYNGGIYHHLQYVGSRQDSIGTDLPSVVFQAINSPAIVPEVS